MNRVTKNNDAWNYLFNKYKILDSIEDNNNYIISSKQINEIREARLMAKFDTLESLPKLFKDNELNINAISNGLYIIFKDPNHKSFIKLPDFNKLKQQSFSPNFSFSLDLEFKPNMPESHTIDYAHHSGLINKVYSDSNFKLTTRGRFFSDEFSFYLLKNLQKIDVKGVQIEVDAGLESKNQYLIIEAKSSTRDTFNIRQLFYPYQHFKTKTNKPIKTILLSFSNGVYYFTEIEFKEFYYSYRIINNSAFEIIIDRPFQLKPLHEIINQDTLKVKNIPIPQANDLNKIIDLLFFLSVNDASKHEIADFFEFDERQGDYYGNAAMYIFLVDKVKSKFTLTSKGRELIKIKNRDQRNETLVQSILQTKLFNDLIKLYLNNSNHISDKQIVRKIINYGYNETTASRRKSTIKSWMNWIDDNYLSMIEKL